MHDKHNCTDEVMTPVEIEQTYGVSRQAVHLACQKGWLPSRKSGQVYLILRADADARWGERTQSSD